MRRRYALLLLFILHCSISVAQPVKKLQISGIDSVAESVGYFSLDTLAQKLMKPCRSDSEKLRCIFHWVTAHIGYDVAAYHKMNVFSDIEMRSYVDSADSVRAEIEYNDKCASRTLQRKMGVCDDYARLMQALCRRAGLVYERVSGASRNSVNSIGAAFKSSHAWNAVKFYGKWRLLDACWASGTCNNAVTKFTRETNEYYYLTDPRYLIRNHYPEDYKWALIPDTVTFEAFSEQAYFTGYTGGMIIRSYSPANGHLKAKVGDIIEFRIEVDSATNSDLYQAT